jgi:predicted transcriptional regulator
MTPPRVQSPELFPDLPATRKTPAPTNIPAITRADYHVHSYRNIRRHAVSHGASCLLVSVAKFQVASVPELADHVGMTQQTVYHHLERHDDLFTLARDTRPSQVTLTAEGIRIVTDILQAHGPANPH